MSQIQTVKQFLSAAAAEIVEAVEKMISGYEEEMFQSKREISRQRKMLDALLQPEIRLNRIPEEAQLNLSVWEKNPESLQTERRHKEPLSITIEPIQVLVKHFLSVTADEIVEAVKKMISGYEGEMFLSKREISRQRKMLDALLQPEIRLNRMPGTEEAQLNLSVSLQTERSHKEPLSSSQDRRPEEDTIHDAFTPQCVKNEIDKVGEEPLPVTSAEQMIIEADEEVPSPGFSEPENGDDDNWNATQDAHSDGSEEWRPGRQHRTLTAKTPRTAKTPQTPQTPQTKKKQKSSCMICGKSFHYERSLMKHVASHPKDVCGLCGMHLKTEEDFKLHLKTHKIVKVLVCDVCGKCFGTSSNLGMHMRSHTAEKPFRCNECGKSFKLQGILTRHLKSHTGEKPFICEVCGRSFSTTCTLTRHHMIHTGEKLYSCTICSKHFIRYVTLRKHMRTHLKDKKITVNTPVFEDGDANAEVEDSIALMTNEQPLRIILCKVCGKDFPSKVSLVNHLGIHPKDDCGLCGKHFNTEEDFELHLKTHMDVKALACDVCGRRFAKPFYLEKHMTTHTGEKPFKCNVCDKTFRQRSQMTTHLKIHSWERPYSCTTCSKCFKTNGNLRQHMQRCRLVEKMTTPPVTTPVFDKGYVNAEVEDSIAQTSEESSRSDARCVINHSVYVAL